MRQRPKLVSPPFFSVYIAMICLLVGCGSSSADTAYGGSQNHLHAILALTGMPNTVVVASHVGFYRSSDAGAHWAETAGLAGQTMEGLMLAQVIQSIADPATLYVLAVLRPDGPQVAHPQPGMYVSHDAGLTWQMATPQSGFPVPQIYALGAGAANAGDVYAIARATGTIYHTADGGRTWAATAPLPDPQGVIGVGAGSRRAFAWSITGALYASADSGATWHATIGTKDGIYAVALAGQTVYASGNDGVFVSHDGGASFTLAATGLRFTTIIASATDPQRAYGLTGEDVQTTTDGGATWQPVAATSRHAGNLTIDPAHSQTIYAGFSYPIGLDRTDNGGAAWQQIMP